MITSEAGKFHWVDPFSLWQKQIKAWRLHLKKSFSFHSFKGLNPKDWSSSSNVIDSLCLLEGLHLRKRLKEAASFYSSISLKAHYTCCIGFPSVKPYLWQLNHHSQSPSWAWQSEAAAAKWMLSIYCYLENMIELRGHCYVLVLIADYSNWTYNKVLILTTKISWFSLNLSHETAII